MSTITNDRLAERSQGLGGTDAAPALGLSPWKTPFELYQEKIGEAPAQETTERMRLGTRLEQVIADEYEHRTGRTLHRVNRSLQHKEHPWMRASLDRRIVGEQALVECKSVGTYAAKSDEWGPEGTDAVPVPYLLQVMHYLAVTGYERGELAALVGGNELRIYVIRRDDQLIDSMIAREAAFWQRVVDRDPPTPSTVEEAKLRWPRSVAVELEATAEVADACAKLAAFKREAKDLEKAIDDYDTIVRSFMGEADTLTHGGKVLATWKESKSAMKLDAKALEAEHPDLLRKFYREVPGARRFLLK